MIGYFRASMPYYIKAVQIDRLRAFPSWPGDDEADDAVVFLHPDYSVRKTSLIDDEAGVVWTGGTEPFRRYCVTELDFDPPT